MNSRLRGVFTAIVTPFNADGTAIDESRLADQIAYQAAPASGAPGVNGIVPVGTTGESPTLSESEQQRVIEIAVQRGRELGLTVIAGAGSNNTAHAVAMQRFAHEAGADFTLSVVPYYNKPSQEGMYAHFSAIADAADIGTVLYNIPGRSGVGLTVETIARLAEHPNIVGVKEATGTVAMSDQIAQRCPELTVLSGDDPLTLPIISVGGAGVISVLSNLIPARVRSMVDAALAGGFDEARREHAAMYELGAGLLTLAPNPVGVKMAMAMMGRDSGSLRLPLTPAGDSTRSCIRELLTAGGML